MPPVIAPRTTRFKDAAEAQRIEDGNILTLRSYYEPPFTRTDAQGADVYSRDTNRITCAATVPAQQGQAAYTWLGTRLGIKRVTAQTGVLRHYGQKDNLPGDVVREITADAAGAAALIALPDGGSALCWWNARTDTWQQVVRIAAIYKSGISEYDRAAHWRVLLTPTRLVLVPPVVEGQGQTPLSTGLTIWQRSLLDRGQMQPATVLWNKTLPDLPYRSDAYTAGVAGAAAIGETVFVGGRLGLFCVPEATITAAVSVSTSPDSPGAANPPASGFLSASPPLPRFWTDSTVGNIATHAGKLWLTLYPKNSNYGVTGSMVEATPVVQDGVLVGIRQSSVSLPLLPYEYGRQVNSGTSNLVVTDDGPWLLTRFGFLHQNQGQWERLDADGKKVAMDAQTLPGAFDDIMFYFRIRPQPIALIAPDSKTVPDVVAQKWVEETTTGRWSAEYDTQRRVAWIRQRFPYYFSRPATLPRFDAAHAVLSRYPSDEASLEGTYFSDPWLPGTSWHTQYDSKTETAAFWSVPTSVLPPWHFEMHNGGGLLAVQGTVPMTAARSTPLPTFPARISLEVKGLGVRPEGLYIGVPPGILFIPEQALSRNSADFAAGAQWIPQETDQGIKPKYISFNQLHQAGKNGPLIVEQTGKGHRLLRFDAANRQFVRDTTLPAGQVMSADETGLITRSMTSPLTTQWLPLQTEGTVNSLLSRALPSEIVAARTGFPFLNQVYTPLLFSQGKLWYIGDLKNLEKPRYAHDGTHYAIAGYDPQSKTWTTPRELPWDGASGSVTMATLSQEDGTLTAVFDAPDGSVWQYEPARDEWHAIAPALPEPPPQLSLPDGTIRFSGKLSTAVPPRDKMPLHNTAPFLWTAKNGNVWLLFRGTVYHHAPSAKEWEQFDASDVLATLRSDFARPYSMATFGDGLLLGGDRGLWRFDTVTHTWAEIAPLASSLPDNPVRLNPVSFAADKDFVYQAGQIGTKDFYASAGFLLAYDRKGHWVNLTAKDLNLVRMGLSGRVWSDGLTVWYTSGKDTRRRDPATGTWQTIAGPERLQVVADPSDPGSAFLRGKTTIQRYDRKTGQIYPLINTLPDTFTLFSQNQWDNKMTMPHDTQIQNLVLYQGDLIAVTSRGQYRINWQARSMTRLPLPVVEEGMSAVAEDGSLYLFNHDTVLRLRN